MYQVNIGGRVFAAEAGELLSSLLQRCGIEAPHPCAGRGSCGKCRAYANGEEILTCQYKIEADTVVVLPDRGGIEVTFADDGGDFSLDGAFFALDIGTTTLSMALCDRDGRELCRVDARNPQISFGADVISRIEQCERGGAESLQKPLIKRINEMIATAKAAVGASANKVEKLYAAGNATMLHLLLGIDCTSIGRAPYTPIFLEEKEVLAASLGLEGFEKLHVLPSAHSFVGADVMAGLSLIELPVDGRYSLFVDLGTNAEIVLASRERILCTAAAAGPCFEGSNIDCGMSALSGAVCSVDIDESGVRFETVGGTEAKGICATGLIDTIYSLLKTERIDETGYMEGDFYLSDKVFLSPRDVRNFQLAKSAVHSAIEALMARAGVEYGDIDALYVSGGFAKKLSIHRAAVVGLIPRLLLGKCRVLEDSCLEGTKKYALGDRNAKIFAEIAEYCDLSADGVFAEKFIENMSFEV